MNAADRRCLERLQSGDLTGLVEMYDRYASLLHPVALRIIGDPRVADEAVFDAWMAVVKKTEPVDAHHDLRSRLVALVRDRALALRQPGNAPAATPATHDDGPIEVTQDRVALTDIATEALATLEADERRVLDLAFFDGLTESEIAGRLQAQRDEVRRRTRSALERLLAATRREEAA